MSRDICKKSCENNEIFASFAGRPGMGSMRQRADLRQVSTKGRMWPVNITLPLHGPEYCRTPSHAQISSGKQQWHGLIASRETSKSLTRTDRNWDRVDVVQT